MIENLKVYIEVSKRIKINAEANYHIHECSSPWQPGKVVGGGGGVHGAVIGICRRTESHV